MSRDLDALVTTNFDAGQILPVRQITSDRDDTATQKKWSRRTRNALLFLIVVIIPTLASATYFIGVAADQYASETRFLVRSPQRASAGILSGFLQSTGFVRAQDDIYAVSEFIKSRDAAAQLIAKHHLREVLSRSEADILTRFPHFWSEDTSEALFRHYLNFIKVQTDSTSGITTLEVRAFRSRDAEDIASALLQEAEEFANRLNSRAMQDAIRAAQKEIDAAEARYVAVQQQITDFRNREAMIDPDKQATSILEMISRLSLDVVEKRARIYEIERQASISPQIAALKSSIAAVEDQISHARNRIAGNDASIAPRLSQYEGLLLQRELVSRRLSSATASLETARLDAQQQQIYVERIVEPNLPDHAKYPMSALFIALTFVVAFSAYLIVRAFSQYLSDHAEQ